MSRQSLEIRAVRLQKAHIRFPQCSPNITFYSTTENTFLLPVSFPPNIFISGPSQCFLSLAESPMVQPKTGGRWAGGPAGCLGLWLFITGTYPFFFFFSSFTSVFSIKVFLAVKLCSKSVQTAQICGAGMSFALFGLSSVHYQGWIPGAESLASSGVEAHTFHFFVFSTLGKAWAQKLKIVLWYVQLKQLKWVSRAALIAVSSLSAKLSDL